VRLLSPPPLSSPLKGEEIEIRSPPVKGEAIIENCLPSRGRK